MSKFLDLEGLEYLVGKIKDYHNSSITDEEIEALFNTNESEPLHMIEIWADEACTVRPVTGQTYSKLYVQINKEISNVYSYGEDQDNSIDFYRYDEEYPEDSEFIRFSVDFVSNSYFKYEPGVYTLDGGTGALLTATIFSYGDLVESGCTTPIKNKPYIRFTDVSDLDADYKYRYLGVKVYGISKYTSYENNKSDITVSVYTGNNDETIHICVGEYEGTIPYSTYYDSDIIYCKLYCSMPESRLPSIERLPEFKELNLRS